MKSFIPIRNYQGDQAIITSDRIIFNAKDDNIFLIAKDDLSVSVGGAIHFNAGAPNSKDQGNNFFVINAPKIQLGLGQIQPIPRGTNNNNALNEIANALNDLATNLSTATGIGVGTVSEPTVNAAGVKLQAQVQNIKNLIKEINSKVSYTI